MLHEMLAIIIGHIIRHPETCHVITGYVTPRNMPVKVLLSSGCGPAELPAFRSHLR